MKAASVVVALMSAAALAPGAQAAPTHAVSIDADGRDELRFGNGTLAVRHFSWGRPTGLVVDGTPLPLVWNVNTSEPVPVPVAGDFWVRKALGRDGAYAVQRADGFALAVADNPNGGDTYRFDLAAAPDANTTEWMRVLGAGATPGRMSFPSVPGYAPRPAGGVTTFSLWLDGTDELMFVDGNLVIRHLSWLQPASLTIDGVPQALTFGNNLSNPIALPMPEQFQFTQTGGRTTLYPVQTPRGLLVGADDELLGPDTYTWTITAVPEPGGLLPAAGAAALMFRRRRRWQHAKGS